MPRRSRVRPDLDTMFRQDLGVFSEIESKPRKKPLLATLAGASGLKIQAYLWHATAPNERDVGVHKIQITLPGVPPGTRIQIPIEPGRLVLFCGFAAPFNTWILWDAELFMVPEGISYSRNLGVSVEALAEATVKGVSVSRKRVRRTVVGPLQASIVACRRSSLVEAIETRFWLSVQNITGND